MYISLDLNLETQFLEGGSMPEWKKSGGEEKLTIADEDDSRSDEAVSHLRRKKLDYWGS